MAIRVDASPDRLLRTSSLISVDDPYTVMLWVRMANAGASGYNTIFIMNNGGVFGETGAEIEGIDIVDASGNLRVEIYYGYGTNGTYANATGTTNLSTATWYHLALVRTGDTQLLAYLNAALEITHTTADESPRTMTRNEIGLAWPVDYDPFDGRVAGIKAWSVALSAAEILNEYRTLRPQRFENLHAFWPLIGSASDLADYSGNGRDWTAGGTLTAEDGPPVSW